MQFRFVVSASLTLVLISPSAMPALAVADSVDFDNPTESSEPDEPGASEKTISRYSTASAKGAWSYKGKRKVSYVYADGAYPTRVTRIGKKVYLFKSKGRLSTSKKALRIVDVDGNKHGVSADGSLVKGWQVKGDSLYWFGGKYLKGKARGKRGDIRFASSGKAVYDLNAAVKIQCMKVVGKVATPKAGKAKKLRAVWRYVTSRNRWAYSIGYSSFSFLSTKTWAKRYAYEMFASKKGDCYGFAAIFAALAHEIGYENVQVVTCRVPGSRDRASDGYTRHGLAKVNGKWYDPEAQYAGWCTGVYGYRHYPMGMKARKARQWSWYKGTGKPRGITRAFNSSVKLSIVKKSGYYYGKENGKPITGLYYYKDHLYKFDGKGRMKVSAYAKLQKAIRPKKPWSKLKKLIGAPSGKKVSSSCYGDGKDAIYFYDEIQVSTFRPADGGTEIVLSVSAR